MIRVLVIDRTRARPFVNGRAVALNLRGRSSRASDPRSRDNGSPTGTLSGQSDSMSSHGHSQITVNMHMRAFGILKVLFNFKVAASQVSCCTATVAVDICPVRGIIQSVPSQKKKRK